MSGLFWTSGESFLRVVLTCVVAYVGIVALLRVGGKRATSKLNAYDWVVNVALGSMLAAIVLTDRVPLAEGLAAFATLLALQWLLAWLTARSRRVASIVKSTPTLLYWRGSFLRDRMRRERVAEDEILAAVRGAGHGALEEVEAVVLETNAELSVVRRLERAPAAKPLEELDIPERDVPEADG